MFKPIVRSLIHNPNFVDPGIKKTRTAYLNLLLIFAILIIAFDIFNSATHGFRVMAYTEAVALFILVATYFLYRRSASFKEAAYLLLGTVSFMSVFALNVEGYGKESALFWTASLPIYVFLLLGTYRGMRLNTLIMAGILWSTANAYFAWIEPIFSFDVLIQLMLGYFAIAFSVYYFEKMRDSYEIQLSKALREREALLDELNRQKERIESSNVELAKKVEEIERQDRMLIAQSRLAAMGEMMSMIAHQWRQPLATMSRMIAGYNIKAMIETRPRDERDRILGDISTTLQYLSETVEDFQTYFKPTNSLESSSVRKILERAAEFTKARLQYNGIALRYGAVSDFEIHTYSNEIVQVVINIINNAVDAIMQYKPPVKLITMEAEEREGSVLIRIRDTGGGISAEHIDKIFEPYFSTKSKNGTGLGLYMAKMIVARHGNGQIDVENSGEGCTFTLTLPKSAL